MSKKHKEQSEAVAPGDIAVAESTVTATAEETETVSTDTQVESKVEILEKELAEANQAKDEMYNRMLRVQADFDNFRRRSRQEVEQLSSYGGGRFTKKDFAGYRQFRTGGSGL